MTVRFTLVLPSGIFLIGTVLLETESLLNDQLPLTRRSDRSERELGERHVAGRLVDAAVIEPVDVGEHRLLVVLNIPSGSLAQDEFGLLEAVEARGFPGNRGGSRLVDSARHSSALRVQTTRMRAVWMILEDGFKRVCADSPAEQDSRCCRSGGETAP